MSDDGEAIGEQQAIKHVTALAAHVGAGVRELDVFVDVLGRELNDAGLAGRGQRTSRWMASILQAARLRTVLRGS